MKKVSEINSRRFAVPAGWETKDQVAVSLQCDPDKVSDILKPGVADGTFERQEFQVWDDCRRMTVRVSCYRIVRDGEGKAPAKLKEKKGPTAPPQGRDGRIKAAILKYPERTDAQIAKNLNQVSSVEVAQGASLCVRCHGAA